MGTWELTAVLSGDDISPLTVAQSAEIIGSLWVSAPEFAEKVSTNSYAAPEWLTEDGLLTHDIYAANYYFARREPADLMPAGAWEQVLTVGERDAAEAWKVVHTLRSMTLGAGDYAPTAWANGLLYFSQRPIPEGGCDEIKYPSDLWQVNLASGETRRLLPSVGLRGFSAATKRAAGLTGDGFRVFDLNSKRLMEFSAESLNPQQVTTLHFNADGSQMLIFSADFPCGESNYRMHLFDFVSAELRAYPETISSHPLTVTSWERDRVIVAASDGQRFEFDLTTGSYNQ